jgi:ATP synthase F1 delta subunit
MVNQRVLAKRYARAFLDVYQDKFDTHFYDTLRSLEAYFAGKKTAHFFLKLSSIASAEKERILIEKISSFAFSGHEIACMKSLLGLLSASGRLFIIKTVLHEIIEIYRKRNNIVSCVVTTSHAVASHEIDRVVHFLQGALHKNVTYSHHVDTQLIAGIRAQGSTFLWEDSVAQQLRYMRNKQI